MIPTDYPYIRAWGLFRRDSVETTKDAILVAGKDQAPQNAVYKIDGVQWVTLDQLNASERRTAVSLAQPFLWNKERKTDD